jgi:hypothetical protein
MHYKIAITSGVCSILCGLTSIIGYLAIEALKLPLLVCRLGVGLLEEINNQLEAFDQD